ncbi:UDP-glucuronosyltransferase 1A6-like [Zonotrichia albicollis]|uniref:UDP-glucuronosyltransferase 1A6-like n=1 Tax=Zonotrichia albicollis TaxID=44394 RepID=UPI003D80EAF5
MGGESKGQRCGMATKAGKSSFSCFPKHFQARTCRRDLFYSPYCDHSNMALRVCCAWISIVLLLLPGLSDGGKLLVVPMVGSHWLSMREVVVKLSEKGHEVVVLVPEVSWQTETTQDYKVVTYPVSQSLEELDNAFREYVTVHLTQKPFPLNALAMYNASVHTYSTFFGQCKDLFRNQETLRFLNQSAFDAVLTDPIFMCGTILAHHLSLPFVFFMRGFGCNLHFSAPQSPSPLSYIPRLFSFNSDHMTFFQRVENALISLLELDYCNVYYAEALKLSSEVLQRDVSLMDLVNSAAIWILRFDFVFEYVRPVMPNMVFVGGINCEKKKPLPKPINSLRALHVPSYKGVCGSLRSRTLWITPTKMVLFY